MSYPPLEAVILADEPATRMYIVQKGLCARPGQLLGKDMIFGDDMIMTQTRYVESVTTWVFFAMPQSSVATSTSPPTRPHPSHSRLTYNDLCVLSKLDLEAILDTGNYPLTKKKIRKSAIKLALRREFIHYARAVKRQRTRDLNGGQVSVKSFNDNITTAASKEVSSLDESSKDTYHSHSHPTEP